MERLLTEFMFFLLSEGHQVWKGEKLVACVLFFFQLVGNRLARSFRALEKFFERLPVEMCRTGGTLAAMLTLVMFESYLRPGEMLPLRRWSFFASTEGGVRSWVILLFPGTARSKLERRTTRSVLTQNDVHGWGQCSKGFNDDNHRTSLCSAEPPQTSRWIWCHIKAATLQLRWTGPKTCEHWSPHKNADDGNLPSLCAATRKTDVSTKVGQSELHWSRRTAIIATASCLGFASWPCLPDTTSTELQTLKLRNRTGTLRPNTLCLSPSKSALL